MLNIVEQLTFWKGERLSRVYETIINRQIRLFAVIAAEETSDKVKNLYFSDFNTTSDKLVDGNVRCLLL